MNIKLPTIRSSRRQPALTESAIPRIRVHLCPSVVKSDSKFPGAFTLVELLIVIAVIAIIAALLIPTIGAAKRRAVIQQATSEMHQLETALDAYHAKYGFYPPGNANPALALTNQLYYELCGTTSDSAGAIFTNLDDSGTLATAKIQQYFGVSGFMNVTKGTGDDAKTAINCFSGSGLRPAQIATNSDGIFLITTSANSDAGYAPLSASGFQSRSGLNVPNPWRYVYPGVNNPNSYDLWVQIFLGGKTNLICNWKEQVTYNSPLP